MQQAVDTYDCIEWDGPLTSGYGRTQKDGRETYIHRVVWEEVHGDVPRGLSVLHRCDNPPCFNADHLYLGRRGDSPKRVALKTSEGVLAKMLSLIVKEPESGCWLWQGRHDQNGYGQISFNYAKWRVHRLLYTLLREPIPDSLFLCHKCDNPPCVNPGHLFIGTQQDNMQDALAKGRMVINRAGQSGKTHCKYGHPFNTVNTRIRANGHRRCLDCVRRHNVELTARRKGKKV